MVTWQPVSLTLPPGYRVEIEFVDGTSHVGGVIYWIRRDGG